MATQRTEVDMIVKAIAEGFDKMGGEIKKIGTAQDKLALSVLKSETAQKKLAAAELAVSKNADPSKQNKLTQSMLKARIAADQAEKETKEYAAALTKLQKESSAAEKGTSGLRKTLAGFTLSDVNAGMALAGRGLQVLKEGFDSLKEGAAAKQTAESFEFLINKVGGATDTLEQLRAASRGTIDDGTLMASTLTLTAGAGDELAKRLFDAAPQLAEIAKASNKLNPALGDTAFLMQSLGTGVKRASPLILDNLGLTIKIGTAEKRFAESIGKTVAQLSAEEKQIALLNDVLRAGDTLIDQVGGSVESTGDVLARFETRVENLVSDLKVLAIDAVLPTLDGLDALAVVLDPASTKTQELETALAALTSQYGENNQKTIIVRQALESWQNTLALASAETQVFQSDMREMAAQIEVGEDAARRLALGFQSLADKETALSASTSRGIASIKRMTSGMADNRDTVLDLMGAEEGLAFLIKGELDDAIQEFAEGQAGLIEQQRELIQSNQALVASDGELVTWQTNAGLSAEELRERELSLQETSVKLAEAQEAQAEAAGDSEANHLALQVAVDKAKIAAEEAASALPGYGEAFRDNVGDINANAQALTDLNADIAINRIAFREATQEKLFNMALEQAAVDGLSEVEEEALLGLAKQWGLTGKASGAAAVAVIGATQRLSEDENISTFRKEMQGALGDVIAFADGATDAISRIPRVVPIEFQITQRGRIPGVGPAGAPTGPESAAVRQHGGLIPSGAPALLHPPEILFPAQGVATTVMSQADTKTLLQSMKGGGAGGPVFNVTINANSRAEGRAAADGFEERLGAQFRASRGAGRL